jgi:prepilin-type processing-associated H-X9-DG protein
MGKARLKGYGRANPQLANCNGNPSCYYVAKAGNDCVRGPNGTVVGGGASTGASGFKTYLLHHGGMNFAYADGHVKWQKLGPAGAGTTNAAVDPWLNYNAEGIGTFRHLDGCHGCLMRPYVNPGSTQAACVLL